jgi:hypothetical protein
MYIIAIDFCFLVLSTMPEEILPERALHATMLCWCVANMDTFSEFQLECYIHSLTCGIAAEEMRLKNLGCN